MTNGINTAELELWTGSAPVKLDEQPLVAVRDGPVLHVLLNTPKRRNAVNQTMWRALTEVFDGLEAEPSVRVVVLRGVGGRAFCAGADISEFAEVYANAASTRQYNDLVRTAQLAIERCRMPTVAIIEGACIGAGMGIALACDIRLAGESASFGVPPARLGIAYSPEDSARLAAVVGMPAARELLLTGRRIDAAEACRLGAVCHVRPDAELQRFAREYVLEQLVPPAPGALSAIKLILRGITPATRTDLDALRPAFDDRFESPDFRAAYLTFLTRPTKGKH